MIDKVGPPILLVATVFSGLRYGLGSGGHSGYITPLICCITTLLLLITYLTAPKRRAEVSYAWVAFVGMAPLMFLYEDLMSTPADIAARMAKLPSLLPLLVQIFVAVGAFTVGHSEVLFRIPCHRTPCV